MAESVTAKARTLYEPASR